MKRTWLLVLVTACGSSHGAVDGGTRDAAVDAPGDAIGDAPGDSAPDGPIGPLGDPFAGLQALPSTCTADGWCWWRPQPAGNTYDHIFSTAPDNIWLIGGTNVVFQWNGHAWTVHHLPLLPDEDSVQLSLSITSHGPNDTWIIYGTSLDHWDGTSWTIVAQEPANGNPSLNNLWASPDGSTWVTVSNGTLQHWQGGTYTVVNTGCGCFLGAIWGTAANDFFVTAIGEILHSDGQTFTPIDTGGKTVGWYQGTQDDVWISGESLFHWDGAALTQFDTGLDSSVVAQTVGMPAHDDAWWFGGDSSASYSLIHWDGSTVTTMPIDHTTYDPYCCSTLSSAAIIDGKWWFVGGDGGIYTRIGTSTLYPIVAPQLWGTETMWGTADDNMYFATGGQILHWDGAMLTTIDVAVAGISGVHQGTSDELFGIGLDIDFTSFDYLSNAYHFDGTSWTKTELVKSPVLQHQNVTSIYALGPGEAMAIGSAGLMFHFHNGRWTPVTTNSTADLVGIWGPDADHLYITGTAGTLLQWMRADPAEATPDSTFPTTTTDLGAVHGADGLVWITMPSTLDVWKHDAVGWTMVATPVVPFQVWATSATDVVVSDSGQSQLARWNGSAFVREDIGAWGALSQLFKPPGGHMYLASGEGIVQHP